MCFNKSEFFEFFKQIETEALWNDMNKNVKNMNKNVDYLEEIVSLVKL